MSMKGRRRISLVRHGQSESNVTGRWQGHGDSPLSALGLEQAAALAERLSRWELGRFVASDLSRAADTGRATASLLGKEIHFDAALREIDVGAWEGLTRVEVAQKFPHEIAALAGGQMIAIGGAESWADLARRSRAAIAALRDALDEGEHAVVFSHGGFIASLVAGTFAISRDRPTRLGNVANTSVTTIEFEGDRARLLRFNDTSHLGPLNTWGEDRLQKGATAVSLLPGEHDWYARGEAEYAFGEGEGERIDAGSVSELVSILAQRHPGARVGVRLSADTLRDHAHHVLASSDAVGEARGVTHVVVHEGRQALADYNLGD